MKQNKTTRAPRASKRCADVHFEEAVVEPYTVIIHDPEMLKVREEPAQISAEPEIELLIEETEQETLNEDEKTDVYVARYSEDNTKVFNPASKRFVLCDGPIAKRLNLIR